MSFIIQSYYILKTKLKRIRYEKKKITPSITDKAMFDLLRSDTTGKCLEPPSCGARYPGFLRTSHPEDLAPDEHVQGTLCFGTNYDCCFKRATIAIMKCKGFWIYELPRPTNKGARYCGNKGKLTDMTQYIEY